MKFIHTADWHLGIDLAGHDRLTEQSLFLAALLDICRDAAVDALLVAGDIFDSVNPSVAAQQLLASFQVRFHTALPRATLIMTGGNHDSAARLEIVRPFAETLGRLHIIGSLDARKPEVSDKALVPIRDAAGETIGMVAAVPFMRIGDLDCRSTGDEPPAASYERALGKFYRDLGNAAIRSAPGKPLIAMGHLTLQHSERAGSEHLLIGGIDAIRRDTVCDGFDYTALGHIHRGQRVGGETVRYSGSPLSIDFDERRYAHQVLLVEIDQHGETPRISSLPIEQPVPFLRIPEKAGTWDDLTAAFLEIDWSTFADRPKALHPFVQLQLRQTPDLTDLRTRVEVLCRDTPLRMVGSPRIQDEEALTDDNPPIQTAAHLDLNEQHTPRLLLRNAWQKKFGAEVPAEVLDCFDEALAAARIDGEHV